MFFTKLHELLDQWIDRPLPIHTKIGAYRIKDVLGSGSYGIAYLVEHSESGKLYTAKQVKQSKRNGPKGIAMQQYEALILQQLQHSNVPRMIDQITERGRSFLVMDYISGVPLEDILFKEHRRFSTEESLILIQKIARIVRVLHQQRVIHRDVRIPNIILHQEEPFLIDFGLARYLGDTPTYEASDVSAYSLEKQCKREIHPRSDLYSLGHLLLFLLYSTYESTDDVERSWEEELDLPEPVRLMLRKLLQLDEPYQDVDELLHALDKIRNEQTQFNVIQDSM